MQPSRRSADPRAAALLAAALLTASGAGAAGRLALVLPGEGPQAPVAAALGQALAARGIQVVAADAVAAGGIEADPVRGAAAAGCDLVAVGRVESAGYRLAADLVLSADGRVLARETVEGPREQVFDLIEQLGQRLARDVGGVRLPQGTVAVLAFGNEATAESAPFVSGIPQMLLTSLRQHPALTLVEPRPPEPTDASRSAAEMGRWLGADVAVTGSFTDLLRVQLELIATSSGRSLGRFERSGPRASLPQIAADLAAQVEGAAAQHRRSTRTVAVLPFQNHGDERHGDFVRGLAEMLTTSLGQTARLTVIERVQIETAMANFHLEMSGPIDPETAVEVGAWLGADAVVLGSFLQFGGVFRMDARMIDAGTGEVLVAASASGAEPAVVAMVDELGGKLVARFDAREPEDGEGGTGTLEVVFQMRKAEMGERPVYHHICKLYVDGRYVGLSPIVDRRDQWTTLFRQELRSGAHRVHVVHGFVKGTAWDGQMPVQPEPFDVVIEAEATAAVRYTYEVGWFEDRYIFDAGAP